jgi:hypothetical protein
MDATITRAPRLLLRENVGALVCYALLSAALLLGLMHAPAALADGDPASDVLLAQNAYYPYQPTVSSGLEATLNKLLGSAEHSPLPLKVAVIGSAGDLGVVPSFFGHPQAYAQFLDREISFNNRPPLLVVMPAGFGLVAAGSSKALATIKIDTQHGSDGLVRSAIEAVVVLLRTAGHTLAKPSLPSASSGGGGPPTSVLFGAPVGLLFLVGVIALFRDRRDRARRPVETSGEGK